MTKYAITWEEFLEFYLELHPDALPSPSTASFVAAVLIAIAAGVGAAILTYQAPPENKTKAAFTFILLPLGVCALAFWERIRIAIKRKRAEQELRSAYEREYAGSESFTFDHARWTLTTEAGKLEISWAGLLSAAELQTTFALWGKNHFTLVPKRALTGEEIGSLRPLALASGGKLTSFHIGLRDYMLTEIPSFWSRNSLTPVFCVAVVTIVFVIGKILVENGSVLMRVSLLGATFLGILTMQSLYYLIKYMIDRKSNAAFWEGEFSDRGVRAKTHKSDIFLAWTCFKKFKETRRCFLLYCDSDKYYILGKSCLSADQRAALRQLFQAKLTSE